MPYPQIFGRGNLTTLTATDVVKMSTGNRVSFHFVWESSPTAKFTVRLQTSNDPLCGGLNPALATWFTEPTSISGSHEGIANGNSLVEVSDVSAKYCRLLLTPTVTGTVTVRANVK